MPKNSDNAVTETGNGVTKNLVQDFVQTLQQPNTDSTIKLHGVTNNSQLLANEATDPALTRNIQVGTDTVEINSTPTNPTQTSDVDNSSELKGVTTNDDIPLCYTPRD